LVVETYGSPIIVRVEFLLPTKLALIFAQRSSSLLDKFQEVLELLSVALEFLGNLLVVIRLARYNLILAAEFNPSNWKENGDRSSINFNLFVFARVSRRAKRTKRKTDSHRGLGIHLLYLSGRLSFQSIYDKR
jgi:hypothetical protein